MLESQIYLFKSTDYNPEMIRLGRESRGITQKDLCEAMGIKQGTMSKVENGLLPFSEEVAERAAKALNYPISFFAQKDNIYPISTSYFRRIISLPSKAVQQVEAKLNIARMSIERLLSSVDFPSTTIFPWNVETSGTPERAAKVLREQWHVPKGPIKKLIQLLEDNGILVVGFDFGVDGVEGFAVRTTSNVPIIFFNRHLKGDRRRLTVAHELGHLFMHILQVLPESRDIEEEAFRFASEFLVPESEFTKGLNKKLDLATLANLKRYWHVSMRSLIMKAEKSEFITSNQARYLWQQMAKHGYIKREPEALDISIEEPTLLREIIEVYEQELGYTISELSNLVSLTEKEFKDSYLFKPEDRPRFTIIRNAS
ncbi:XRE family transcriptional regulator [Larkinella sp. GY13]|uniref:XRE family transcriptional regulator n=1 Tax=Larkinella sp. GY13 TaxID=3453720 RepID=UPI003EEA03D9